MIKIIYRETQKGELKTIFVEKMFWQLYINDFILFYRNDGTWGNIQPFSLEVKNGNDD